MQDTPKGLRRHIIILGRRNAGKSCLFNTLARQEIAIVSATPGATADPVEKTLEIAPLGPVVLIDTAGIDDPGELGQKRVERSFAMLHRADLAILATDGDLWDEVESGLLARLKDSNIPFLVVRNKMELGLAPLAAWRKSADLDENIPCLDVSARERTGVDSIVAALVSLAGKDEEKPLLADLLPENGSVLLIVPLDSGAPKGRLILPQVQAIRDCLDGGKICITATEKQLPEALRRIRPDLAVCDSQVVRQAAEDIPESIPLTTFSILMARFKGDLTSLAAGAGALRQLRPGDAVLIQEACSHHAQQDDIGRVKIPALLRKLAGGDLKISFAQGNELLPYDAELKAIVHCGACVMTARQMRNRQIQASEAAIPMTNYGMAISLCQGVLPRTLAIFPQALAAFNDEIACT